jgi:hypothetical protein
MRLVGDDASDHIYKHIINNGSTIDSFLTNLCANPNESEDLQNYCNQVLKEPPWLEKNALRLGKLVFLRYWSTASMALLYYSLIGGFSSPKISKVLDSTGYLTRSTRETWRRLLETLQMIVDVICEDDTTLEIGGKGWISVLKIRFLHSKVRLHLMNGQKSGDIPWDYVTYGIPINQEDLLGTLMSFSINITNCIQDFGAPITQHEIYCYLHLWRYIGYLIGVKEEYNACISAEVANGAISSIALHLLHPDKIITIIIITIIITSIQRSSSCNHSKCHNNLKHLTTRMELKN